MQIDQLVPVDFTALQFAQNKATDTISSSDTGFAGYLASVMDSDQDRFEPEHYSATTTEPDPADKRPEPGTSAQAEHSAVGGLDDSIVKKPVRTSDSRETDKAAKARDVSERKEAAEATRAAGKADDAAQVHASAVPGKDSTRAQTPESGADLVPGTKSSELPAEVSSTVDATKARSGEVAVSQVLTTSGAGNTVEIDINLKAGKKNATTEGEKGGSVNGAMSLKQSAASDGGLRPEQKVAQGAQARELSDRRPRMMVRDLRGAREKGSQTAGDTGNASKGIKPVAFSQSGAAPAQGAEPDSGHAFGGIKVGNVLARTPSTSLVNHGGVMQSLRQTLSEQANAEIVRSAHLVVRGGETGEIRLNLKPENLGRVRIALELQEGHIAGRIFVENSSVREIFEQNLADLIRAFEESGLQAGTLDVALSDSGFGSDGEEQESSRSAAVRQFDRAVPLVQVFEDDHELVDLVV